VSSEADRIIALLDLKPHPEGGYFRETFRDEVGASGRAHSTTIYFLLKGGEISRWHRVNAAEVWHFYRGAPLELRIGKEVYMLGANLDEAQAPQVVVQQPPQTIVQQAPPQTVVQQPAPKVVQQAPTFKGPSNSGRPNNTNNGRGVPVPNTGTTTGPPPGATTGPPPAATTGTTTTGTTTGATDATTTGTTTTGTTTTGTRDSTWRASRARAASSTSGRVGTTRRSGGTGAHGG